MLTKKQKEIASLLFKGHTTSAELMTQYKLNEKQFYKLIHSVQFKEELLQLGESATHETLMIISRYKPIAAKALAALLKSEKPDVARRAALDIINHNLEPKDHTGNHDSDNACQISHDEAWRQIKALANQS